MTLVEMLKTLAHAVDCANAADTRARCNCGFDAVFAEVERREAGAVAMRGALREMDVALTVYFAEAGSDHEDGCPEDDTCGCAHLAPLNRASVSLHRALASDAGREET